MADRVPSAALAPEPQRVRRGRRGLTWATFLLSGLAVAGVLGVAWVTGFGDPCGGPLPGCGNLRNAGDLPVTVQAITSTPAGDQVSTAVVVSDERGVLRGATNEVRVEAGHCLIVEGGPFWDARSVIDRTTESTGVWHPVDEWGAWVTLHDGPCPDGGGF